jgi:hypothetical protein
MNRIGSRRKLQQQQQVQETSISPCKCNNYNNNSSSGVNGIVRWAQRRLSSHNHTEGTIRHDNAGIEAHQPTQLNQQQKAARVISLGSGSLSADGFVEHWCNTFTDYSRRMKATVAPTTTPTSTKSEFVLPKPFLRHSSSFLRVSDLAIDDSQSITESIVSSLSFSSNIDDCNSTTTYIDRTTTPTIYENQPMMMSEHSPTPFSGAPSYANFHYVSSDPPPGHTVESSERWVALDNGAGCQSPIAVVAVNALEQFCREDICLNTELWTAADRSTERLLASKPLTSWHRHTFDSFGYCPSVIGTSTTDVVDNDSVLIWSGKVLHGFYGNDVPLVRAAAIINSSPNDLVQLLLDSNRVREYNEMSLGRTDLLVLQRSMQEDGDDNVDVDYERESTASDASSFGGVTKIVRSQSRPPMLRKTLQTTSLMHARPLRDKSGYIVLTRGVTLASESTNSAATTALIDNAGIVIAEILNGVNIIRHVDGNPNQCLLIAVHHVRSPILPLMLARRLGVQAVAHFIQDLRKCCAKNA